MTTAPTIVLATPHRRHDRLEATLRGTLRLDVRRVRERAELVPETLERIDPRYVFLPHWSWLIPEAVYSRFECVVFHMTDVPFGRGGSPLQNLISRGIYETQLTALRCEASVDAGPVYLKRPLSLHGSAEEVLLRAADAMVPMIADILTRQPAPLPQSGPVTAFTRRRPEDGSLSQLSTLVQVHDVIRMLDADGYPPAFLEVGALRLEFVRSRLGPDDVTADCRISLTRQEAP